MAAGAFQDLSASKSAFDNSGTAENEALIAGDQAVWNARVSTRTQARVGAALRLDPARLYFFDPDTGASLTPHPALAAAVA